MVEDKVALRYVKALLKLSQSEGVLENVEEDMELIANTCKNNRPLVSMLRSPIIKNDKKKTILHSIFGDKVHAITMSIIDILTQKNRLPLLQPIAYLFKRVYNEYKGIQSALLTSTVPLTDELLEYVKCLVRKHTDRKKIQLEECIDTSLIGGFVLDIGDRRIDASISSQLKNFRALFMRSPRFVK